MIYDNSVNLDIFARGHFRNTVYLPYKGKNLPDVLSAFVPTPGNYRIVFSWKRFSTSKNPNYKSPLPQEKAFKLLKR
jgi:hypothetical protein